jgi:hypothetical protein
VADFKEYYSEWHYNKYHSDPVFREKRKQNAINRYYNKKKAEKEERAILTKQILAGIDIEKIIS